jgi:phosphoglycerate dehydrogenase-like enzyme
MKFVIHPAVDSDRLAKLQSAAGLDTIWVNAATPAEALAAMPGTDAFLGKLTPDLLAASDQLKWAQSFTVSLEHYIFPELVDHPCTLTNMRGLFSDVIADQVLGYVICFARNLHVYIRQQLEHRYEPLGSETGRVNFAAGPGVVNAIDQATIFLPSATMGIVGLGAIGKEVARRAKAFGMRVIAVDRNPHLFSPNTDVDSVWGLDNLHTLLAQSEFVVIAAPHTPETVGLFNSQTLALMKANSYLINIGRGAIVVLDDLVLALESQQIAGAALDVFEVEPLPSNHRLWDFPNVIITPHTAGYSTAIAGRHLETLLENVGRFSRNESLINVVDKALWF